MLKLQGTPGMRPCSCQRGKFQDTGCKSLYQLVTNQNYRFLVWYSRFVPGIAAAKQFLY